MRYRRGWIALLVLAALTPLGILATGGAWGEWDLEGIRERVGFEPRGMARSPAGPETPLRDYTVPGLEGSLVREGAGTIVSALAGAAATALAAWAVARIARHGGIS